MKDGISTLILFATPFVVIFCLSVIFLLAL